MKVQKILSTKGYATIPIPIPDPYISYRISKGRKLMYDSNDLALQGHLNDYLGKSKSFSFCLRRATVGFYLNKVVITGEIGWF